MGEQVHWNRVSSSYARSKSAGLSLASSYKQKMISVVREDVLLKNGEKSRYLKPLLGQRASNQNGPPETKIGSNKRAVQEKR